VEVSRGVPDRWFDSTEGTSPERGTSTMPDEFELSRRKALAALGTVGAASAGAGVGTSAFFSDQEPFENNRLVAGTLDVGVGYTAHYSDWSDDEDEGLTREVRMFEGGPAAVGSAADLQDGEVGLPADDAWLIAVDEGDVETFLDNTLTGAYPNAGTEDDPEQGVVECVDGEASPQAADATRPVIGLEDVKPGDFGVVSFDFVLCDNPGYVWVNGALRSASENGTTEPEADDPDEGAGVELLDVVQAALWIENPGSDDPVGGLFQSDDGLLAVGSLRDVLGLGSGDIGTALNGNVPAEEGGGTGRNCFSAETVHSVAFAWWVPVDHGNEIQADGATFDLGLYAEQCRHNDGSGQTEFPRAVAETFLERVDVADDDVVYFAGPVDPGPVVSDVAGGELQVPAAPGTYYVFVVDEQPQAGFSHPLWFAWLDAETGTADTAEGSWWPQFSTSPQFSFPGTPTMVEGLPFFFGTEPEVDGTGSPSTQQFPGQGSNGTDRDDVFDGGNDDDDVTPPKDVLPGDGFLPNVPTPETDFTDESNRNYALVIDGGLPRDIEAAGARIDIDDDGTKEAVWDTHTMAQWGGEIASWIRDDHMEDNFTVQRISQLTPRNPPQSIGGTGEHVFESVPAAGGAVRSPSQAFRQLQTLFDLYDDAFTQGVEDPVQLQFVLVVIAHGSENTEGPQDDGYFGVANTLKTNNPANEWAFVPWRGAKGGETLEIDVELPNPDGEGTITRTVSYAQGIKEWLEAFPDYVDITVIAFTCYSGEAERALDSAVDWIVSSAGVNKRSMSPSIEAFNDHPSKLLSDKFRAMVDKQVDLDDDGTADESENEQRDPAAPADLGPLDN
jgi:predicted ribosomally synthesized peptide with SipW-like signal peptide